MGVLDTMAGSRIAKLRRMALENLGAEEGDHASQEVPGDIPDLSGAVHVSPIRTVHEEQLLENPVEDLQHRKRKPANEVASSKQVKKKKVVIPTDPKSSKGHRSSKKATPVPVDASFMEKNMEEYLTDPVSAAAKLFVHLADVTKLQREEMERRHEELVTSERAKLFNALKELAEKNKVLGNTLSDLKTLKAYVDDLEKSHNSAKSQVEDSTVRISQLNDRIRVLEGERKIAEGTIKRLEDRIQELMASLKKFEENKVGTSSTPEDRCAVLEKELAQTRAELVKSKKEARTAADLALEMAGDGFDLALDQIALVYPSLNLDRAVLNVDHEIEGDQIVKVDIKTNVKTVVHPKSA